MVMDVSSLTTATGKTVPAGVPPLVAGMAGIRDGVRVRFNLAAATLHAVMSAR